MTVTVTNHLFMNKTILTTLLSSSFFVLNSLTHIYAQTIEDKPIKHELSRMPEQASWTVERWNINDVDFELKEISKATKNQSAKFELITAIPSTKSSKQLKNPVAKMLRKGKLSTKVVLKNKIIYHTSKTQLTSTNVFWNIGKLQLLEAPPKYVKTINTSSTNYYDYDAADFPFVKKLIQEKFFKGKITYEKKEYYLYQAKYTDLEKNRELKEAEYEFNIERTGGGIAINYSKLATLPEIEDLIEKNSLYSAIVDKESYLPIYSCDTLSLRKYEYLTDEETDSLEFPQPSQVIIDNIEWYVENVLPEMERRAAQKAKK